MPRGIPGRRVPATTSARSNSRVSRPQPLPVQEPRLRPGKGIDGEGPLAFGVANQADRGRAQSILAEEAHRRALPRRMVGEALADRGAVHAKTIDGNHLVAEGDAGVPGRRVGNDVLDDGSLAISVAGEGEAAPGQETSGLDWIL